MFGDGGDFLIAVALGDAPMTVDARLPDLNAIILLLMKARLCPCSDGITPGLTPFGPWQAAQDMASTAPRSKSLAKAGTAANVMAVA